VQTQSVSRAETTVVMRAGKEQPQQEPNVLMLDHLNLNHEKGRHDLVKAFYFDILGCAVDPRKAENLALGRKGVWANAGMHQFHLSEGETAQVFDGEVSLAYDSLASVQTRLENPPKVLADSAFHWTRANSSSPSSSTEHDKDDALHVIDPWGTSFRLIEKSTARDRRGRQPGDVSEPCGISDLRVHVPDNTPLDSVARFYSNVLGCVLAEQNSDSVKMYCGSGEQTLTFAYRPFDSKRPIVAHEELTVDQAGRSSNAGMHVSLYVADLPRAYSAAHAMDAVYVNHRFKRQAFTLQQAVEQCMFRVLDVIDPQNPERGVLFKLEHEIRAAVTADGRKYKSCPLDHVPQTPWAPAT